MQSIAKRLFYCFLICLCAFAVKAQQAAIPFFYEKVYLHTDRDIYTQGEDIWFKAYLVDGQNHKPINYSHNLYVELISPGLKITMLHVLRMENGLGNGDFKLPDTLSTGLYRIRAYTNWMRNFGDKFVFEKNVSIVNTSGKKATTLNINNSIKKANKKQLVTVKQDTLISTPLVRFFPEGGGLVNGVNSVVAVKAEDEHGRGIAVSGQIFASSNRLVAKFSCDSLGFGSFTLEPDETQKYTAQASIKGKLCNFKLPDAKLKGFTLGVSYAAPVITTEIDCNGYSLYETGGTNLIVVGSHAGKILFKEQVRIQQKNNIIQIPDAGFPEGISKVTLFDDHAKPLGERLFYLHRANSTKLTVATDSTAYHSKQKTTIKIKLSDSTKTNLSLVAVDADMTNVQPANILTYLELQSEIKGAIEHPERYFDEANANRDKQMDLLLMTQGWRGFIWKDLEETKFKQQYDVEQALTLTGHVRKLMKNTPLPDMNITMFAPKATGDKLFHTLSDSSGRFRIDGAVFYGYQFINFNSRRSDGLQLDGNSKGKTGGWIIVDSLFQDRMAVKPVIASIDTIAISPDSILAREKIKQKFSFSGINSLKTVQIKSYKEVFPPEVHPITMVEQKEYGCIGQYVINLIPGAYWLMEENGGPIHIAVGHLPPKIVGVYGVYTDHSPITIGRELPPAEDAFWGQPMDRVLKMTINARETVGGKLYSVSLILRPGSLKVKDIFDNTMADVVGYTKARTFFAPRYEKPDDKPDYRSTIHWEPNITTDAKGEATVSFYNADPKSKIRIVVQGVTDKGVPVSDIAGYVVK